MSSITYPNGRTLTSSALTVSQINKLAQALTCGMLGINPPDYSQVRIDWPTQGQPFSVSPEQNVAFLACVPEEEEYSKVRDRITSTQTPGVLQTWTYTRPWRWSWVLYGPNATDRARALWDATFMDYFSDQLEASQLYLISEPPVPRRVPEQFNAQWWERADFSLELYELVTETIVDSAATSVEVKVYDNSGQVADITVQRS